MKTKIHLLVASIFVLFVASCSSENHDSNTDNNKLFNTDGYFRSEIVQLNKGNHTLLKTAEYNGKKEIIQSDTVNWNKEFELFTASNISSKLNSYTIDSIHQSDTTLVIFKAKEAKLDVRKIELSYLENKLVRLSIEREKENAFYYSSQQLEYIPQTIFTITAKDKMIFSDTTYYHITSVIQ